MQELRRVRASVVVDTSEEIQERDHQEFETYLHRRNDNTCAQIGEPSLNNLLDSFKIQYSMKETHLEHIKALNLAIESSDDPIVSVLVDKLRRFGEPSELLLRYMQSKSQRSFSDNAEFTALLKDLKSRISVRLSEILKTLEEKLNKQYL